MKKTIAAFALPLAFALAANAQAGAILTPYDGGAYQIAAYVPVGESFVAQDSAIKFAFDYLVMNPGYGNTALQSQLLSGAGTSGTVLSTQSFSLAPNYNGFYDIDLSGVALTVGATYTALVSIPGSSPYWGIGTTSTSYAGGDAYLSGNRVSYLDLAMRITPVATASGAVPEPGSLALFALGLAGLGAFMHARRGA